MLNNLSLVGTGLSTYGETTADIQNCTIAGLSANGNSAKFVGVIITGPVSQASGVVELSDVSASGSITQSSGYLYASDSTIGGSINANNPSCTSILYRCTITNDVNLGGLGVIAYSRARKYYSSMANATHRIVGCEFNRNEEQVHAVNIVGASNNVLVANCEMKSIYRLWVDGGGTHIVSYYGLNIDSASSRGVILNNYIQGNSNVTVQATNTGMRCVGTGIKIINNIVITKGWGIRAPFGAIAYGNYVYNCPNRYADGVVPTEDYNLNPKYDVAAHALQADSPCIDGGTTDSRYGDRDGSRADAGPTGGAWYDPSGWTSNVPVVVSFDLSSDQYLEGTLAEIVLSGGSAVSVP